MSTDLDKPAIFLERKRYRIQRLRDVAKMLPILGIVLLFIPLLWRGAPPTSNAAAVQYMFGVWLLLILMTWLVARRIAATEADTQD